MMCLLAHIPVQGQNPYIKHYTVNDGLPSNKVYNVFQDSRKFIWFATDAGAVRFDGTNFKTYTTADGLPNSEIIRIEEDTKGRLWLFHLNGMFSFIYKDRLFTAREEAFLDSLSNNMYFRRMYEDEKGSLYFYSNINREIFVLEPDNEVLKYQLKKKLVFIPHLNNYGNAHTIFRLTKHEGDFWLSLKGGLHKTKSFADSLIPVQTALFYERAFNQKNGSFFLDAYNTKLNVFKLYKYNEFNLIDSLYFDMRKPDEVITDVYEDKAGNIWLSSYFTGIYIYKHGQLIQNFDIGEAQNIFEDHEGNIWIASLGNGVYRMHPSILAHQHIHSNEFSGRGIKTIATSKDSSLWLSDGSYTYKLQKNILQRSTRPLSEGGINQIALLENGLIILNEPNQTLKIYQLKNQNNNELDLHLYSKIDIPIKKFAIALDNKSFTASDNFMLYLHQMEKPVSFIPRMNSDMFTSVFYNAEGQLFAAGKSIFLVKNDSLIPFKPLEQLFGKTIRQHLNLDNETQLFNISGDSLWLFRADSLHSLTALFERNIPSQIKSMCYDGKSGLFMASNSHIYWSPNPMDALRGLTVGLNTLDVRFNNIYQIDIQNENLIIASEDGLTRIPPEKLMNQTIKKPIAYFSQIYLNDAPLKYGLDTSIVRGRHSFSFALSSIHYSPEKAFYAYMLEGKDTSWTLQQSSNIVYQDLRPGKYTFKFKARLQDSDWSDELQHFIDVKPTLVKHPLFFVILVSITVALLVTFILRRKNKLHREQETAHQLVLLEQKALQSMMNPHFIFNALGSIQSYILKNNAADAGLYLSQFARLIRQNLNAIKTSMISLDEEVDRLRNYLDLERLRMNNRFSFIIDIGEEIEEDVLIPTMILQPIVENAIWHGLATLEENGLINIFFTKFTDKTMRIVIEDNGIGTEQAALQTKRKDTHLQIGMNLTLKRLELIGKKLNVKTSITTSDIHPGNPYPGTKVEIIVPYVFEAAEFEENK
ncbi:MAG: histidine kinase [Bacteroidetes bacterium]|nr:histidine kinase [Bacteroidota bacterium]